MSHDSLPPRPRSRDSHAGAESRLISMPAPGEDASRGGLRCSRRAGRTASWRTRPELEPLDQRALLAVVFTGNVAADFPANRADIIVVNPDPVNFPFVQPNVQPNIADIVKVSGFELSAVRLNYDLAQDILFIGLDQPDNQKNGQKVIIGDIDNNLNGSTVDPAILNLLDDPDNFIDFPALRGTETAGVQFDFNRDGTLDAVAGLDIGSPTDPKQLMIARFRDPALGGSRFGEQFPQFAGQLFIGTTPTNGGFEFSIRNFSQFVQAVTGQPPSNPLSFNFVAFAGSANDGGTEEARLGGRVNLLLSPIASISGSVYKDDNNNGQREQTEQGINGVTVILTGTNDLGQAVNLTTTTSTINGVIGAYQFLNLRAGTYTVTETQPVDCLDGRDTAGNLGGNVGNDVISNIVLQSNSQGVNYNFGELRPASLSGSVYKDDNDNGQREQTEQGINGVPVTLRGTDDLGASVTLTTTTSTINGVIGAYQFLNLRPGTYRITETQPVDCLDGKDTIGSLGGTVANDDFSNIVVRSGDAGVNYNFGEIRPARVSGFVYVDTDNDGIRDPGEAPIPGTTVVLTRQDGTPLATTTTGPDGSYQFTNLRPGEYCVNETQPANFTDGKDTPGSKGGSTPNNDQICNIVLVGGDDAINYNFGELSPPPPPLAQLSGFVYVDTDNDGNRDPGEAPIPGTTVTLTSRTGTVLAITTTDNNGFYQFVNLQPGNYCVVETQPANFQDGKDTPGSLGGTTPVNDQICDIVLVAGSNSINNNFGELPPPPPPLAQLSGFVYVDADDDGNRDPGEAPIPGVTITLTNRAGMPLATTTTGPDGSYQFINLQPGNYCVVEAQPLAFLDGKDTPGSLGGTTPNNDQICDIVLVAGSNSINNNFGELTPAPAPAQLSGFVYVDADNDGIRDPGEAPIPGTTVTLTSRTGTVLAITTTDNNGFYQFANLQPGNYCVVETQPANFQDGKDTPGSLGGTTPVNDQICDIVLVAGSNSINNNFGELPPTTAPAQLSGFVYVDADNDGIRDPGEAPIPGVTVRLTNPVGAVLATTTTDANGFYQFANLQPGRYCVVETQPANFLDGKDTPGSLGGTTPSNDQICDIVLTAGSNSVNNNFGELPLVPFNPQILINPHDQGHINTFGNFLVRVNIFGSAGFDVSEIDLTTVRLADAAPTWFLIHRVNGDQFPDLLLVFRSRDLDLPRGPQDVVVSGMLLNGAPFQDSIRVYNQPIFTPNDGASTPPRGVTRIDSIFGANANVNGNANNISAGLAQNLAQAKAKTQAKNAQHGLSAAFPVPAQGQTRSIGSLLVGGRANRTRSAR